MARICLTPHARRVLAALAYDGDARLAHRLGDRNFSYEPSDGDAPRLEASTLSVAAVRKYAGKGLLTLDVPGSSLTLIKAKITDKGRKAVGA